MWLRYSLTRLVLLSLVIQFTICAKILMVLPTPSPSHHIFYRPIIKELSLRGHQVTCVTPNPINDPLLINLTEISTNKVAYEIFQIHDLFMGQQKSRHIRALGKRLVDLTDHLFQTMNPIISDQNIKFDLVIVESLSLGGLYIFKERFNCPLIGLISAETRVDVLDAMGMPPNPSYYAGFYKWGGNNLTFWQRLDNLWEMMDFRYYYHFDLLPKYNQLVRKYFGENSTDLWTMQKLMDLLITNTNPVWHIPRPRVPNSIEIGGLHRVERKPLPQDLQEFLDNSKQGVIYFSLGSNMKSKNLPKYKLDVILEVFRKLPYNILWKWEDNALPNKPENVLIKQWLPQQDILDHPNVKVFITQGGLQSIEEAISSEVPMIGIPFGGDQKFNANRIVALGIGRQISYDDLSVEKLWEMIIDVVNNPSYKQQIKILGNQISDQQTKPLDRAIWWIEYVIRHGGAQHLRSPAGDLSWFKFLMLDVIGFLLIGLIILITLFICLIKFIFKFVLFKFTRQSKLKVQ